MNIPPLKGDSSPDEEKTEMHMESSWHGAEGTQEFIFGLFCFTGTGNHYDDHAALQPEL